MTMNEPGQMKATVVFQKIWEAIHEMTPEGERHWRYIILKGSSRSSKTRSIIQALYRYACDHPKKRLSVWRDVAKDCRDTVGYDMAQVYPDMAGYNRVTFNTTKAIYTFPTRSQIEITGTDDPNKVHGYQGDVIWLNEPYDISRGTFDQLDMRTADVVFIDWNPKQSHFIDDLEKDPRALVIHSTFRDNPFCPPEQKRKILSYQPVSRCAIVEQKLLTEQQAKEYDCVNNPKDFTSKLLKELIRCRDNEAKNSADDFNWQVYGLGLKGERPHRIFRWHEISVEDYRKINLPTFYGCDWGTVDPWGVIEVKYGDGRLYLHELNYLSENQWRERLTANDLAVVNAAHGSEDDKREATGLVTWLFTKLGVPRTRPIICDTNRPIKGNALRRAGWNPIPASKLPGSILDGIDVLNNLKVYYTSSSPNIKAEQEAYSREVDRQGNVLEEPEDANNHTIDPARYVALYLRGQKIIRVT